MSRLEGEIAAASHARWAWERVAGICSAPHRRGWAAKLNELGGDRPDD